MTQHQRWGAASVHSGQELALAAAAAENPGDVTVYAPTRTEHVWVRSLRRWVRKQRPIIRGYVLVSTPRPTLSNDELGRIRTGTTPRLVRDSQGYPARVSEAEVQFLREMEADPELSDDPRNYTLQFKTGRLFLVTEGVFAGAHATCVKDARAGDQRGRFVVGSRKLNIPLAFLSRTG